MFKFITFSISRLSNPEFVAFSLNLSKQLQKSDKDQLGITSEMITQINKTTALLVDQVYVSSGSEHTAAMQAADDDRDRIFRRIRKKLEIVEVADEGSELQKIREVVTVHLLNKYKANVTQLAYQEETAVLSGLLMDLRSKLDEEAHELLGIEDDIILLETANNAFAAAYGGRIVEKATAEMGVTHKLRTEFCDMFDRLCLTIEYNANGSDAKAEPCQTFIRNVNVILADCKKRLDQRSKGGNASDNAGDDTPAGDKTDTGSTNGSTSDSGSGSGSGSSDSGNGSSGSGSGNGTINDGWNHDNQIEF